MWVLRYVAVVALVLSVHAGTAVVDSPTGGLVSYPQYEPGPNLLTNSGFEEWNGTTGKAAGWKDNGFFVDDTVSRTGKGSLRVVDPYLIPYAQSAYQDVPLRKGVYKIGAWVKLKDLATTRPSGVRLCLAAPPTYPSNLGNGCTDIVKGTQDWSYLEQSRIIILEDTTARVSIGAYGEPDGTAWFDDVELREEQQVLNTYMLYPNYRGVLFADQPQTATFQVNVSPAPGMKMETYHISGEVVDEKSGRVVDHKTLPAALQSTVSFDLSGEAAGNSFLARFRLIPSSGPDRSYDYPAYRVVKTKDTVHSLRVGYDAQNRFLLAGKPAFLLGVYDSMGYTTTEDGWAAAFSKERRLFELPINMYLNIWLGEAPNESVNPMMRLLKQHGIYNLTGANCFSGRTIEQMGAYWLLGNTDATVRERTAEAGFGGFYAADECVGKLAPDVFPQYQRMKTLDPGGIVLGTLLPSPEAVFWRDSLDVLATDQYPLVGPEPADGYPLYKVADAARAARNATLGARPVVTTLQFFLGTSNSRWPTTAEIRSMSYAAISEGANGLFFWTLGARGLAWVCNDWCAARNEYFDRLKSVLKELKALEPVLVLPDRPELIAENHNPAIRVRAKGDAHASYVIAYNASSAKQKADLVLSAPFRSVWVLNGTMDAVASGSVLADTLGPNEARVYMLNNELPRRR